MLTKFIEMIWPRLEGEPIFYRNFLDSDVSIPKENIENSVSLAMVMYENQKSRITSIESRSSIYLGFFGTVVAVLAFAVKDLIFQENSTNMHDLVLLFIGLLILYILQVMRYSVKALERRTYHSIDESDFLHGDRRKVAVEIINKVKNNYDVINMKVDYMTMAHEFTTRILWLLFIATISLISLPIVKYIHFILTIDFSISYFDINLEVGDYMVALIIFGLIINSYQIWRVKKLFRSRDKNI